MGTYNLKFSVTTEQNACCNNSKNYNIEIGKKKSQKTNVSIDKINKTFNMINTTYILYLIVYLINI